MISQFHCFSASAPCNIPPTVALLSSGTTPSRGQPIAWIDTIHVPTTLTWIPIPRPKPVSQDRVDKALESITGSKDPELLYSYMIERGRKVLEKRAKTLKGNQKRYEGSPYFYQDLARMVRPSFTDTDLASRYPFFADMRVVSEIRKPRTLWEHYREHDLMEQLAPSFIALVPPALLGNVSSETRKTIRDRLDFRSTRSAKARLTTAWQVANDLKKNHARTPRKLPGNSYSGLCKYVDSALFLFPFESPEEIAAKPYPEYLQYLCDSINFLSKYYMFQILEAFPSEVPSVPWYYYDEHTNDILTRDNPFSIEELTEEWSTYNA